MELSPSDWIAIALVGVGAVVSTFGRRITRTIGVAVVAIGLVGFILSRMYLDGSHPGVPTNSAGGINGNAGIVSQGQVGNNSIGQK